MVAKSGLFVGLNKGFIVTKPTKAPNAFKAQKSLRRGRQCKRVAGVREVVREICGLAGYEKKMIELIKTGIVTKEKKAVKMARSRLGSQKRANNKKQQMDNVIKAQKQKK